MKSNTAYTEYIYIYIRLPWASNLIQNSVFTNVALNIKAAFAMLSHYQ